MDNYIANDHNNPINWNGTNAKCIECDEVLDSSFDYEDICAVCFETENEEAENHQE
tara:strand:+ start:135 stop:302 length:168 start_codon:yes stop_codon:yes gene_type:complete